MSPRTGRPPLDNPRRHTVRYRVTDEELDALERAAALVGQTATDYARSRALAAAKRQK